jgi:hypothetical protein
MMCISVVVCEAGMVACCVKAGGWRDEIASHAHAKKHLATGFVAVADAVDDLLDAERGRDCVVKRWKMA